MYGNISASGLQKGKELLQRYILRECPITAAFKERLSSSELNSARIAISLIRRIHFSLTANLFKTPTGNGTTAYGAKGKGRARTVGQASARLSHSGHRPLPMTAQQRAPERGYRRLAESRAVGAAKAKIPVRGEAL